MGRWQRQQASPARFSRARLRWYVRSFVLDVAISFPAP